MTPTRLRDARDLVLLIALVLSAPSAFASGAIYKYIDAQGDKLDGKGVVVLLPDSIRNYMSKFLDDGWMEENNFTIEK